MYVDNLAIMADGGEQLPIAYHYRFLGIRRVKPLKRADRSGLNCERRLE